MTVSAYNCTGYQTTNSFRKETGRTLPAEVERNVFIVLGYIPVVGAVTGALRINSANDQNQGLTQSGRVYMIVRGIFELLGLGLLFLIPDVAVTMHRFCCTQRVDTTS